jgi:16S rRNA (adenine1518-N6/adenine1519-N6)-dimethyltransferase
VLCLQKEFVEHMLAKEGTRNYSKLSVFSALSLSISEIMDVPKGNFSPVPKIDSEVIYVKPKRIRLTEEQEGVIGVLMQHKKRTVRKAFIDSRAHFGETKERMDEIAREIGSAEKRVFTLSPAELLELADKAIKLQNTKGS